MRYTTFWHYSIALRSKLYPEKVFKEQVTKAIGAKKSNSDRILIEVCKLCLNSTVLTIKGNFQITTKRREFTGKVSRLKSVFLYAIQRLDNFCTPVKYS